MGEWHEYWSFWEVGPILSLFVPEGLLRKGQNEIVIFETEGRFSEVIDFVKEPIEKVRKGEWMMAIIGVRIDGRLIHGQVANLWTTKLNIGRIMVVDDEVATNAIEKSGLKLATPAGVKLSILPIEKAAANILAGKYDSQRVLIVAKKPDRILALVEKGVPIKELNVGNMSQTDETRSITKSINVVDADVEVFKKLDQLGVHLIAQMVPNDKAEDFMSLLIK